jgi:hypothetical protein
MAHPSADASFLPILINSAKTRIARARSDFIHLPPSLMPTIPFDDRLQITCMENPNTG